MAKTKSKQYIILSLFVQFFRFFRLPQFFSFEDKRSMVIYGKNCSGKTAFVDALEYGISEKGLLKRFGKKELNYHTKESPSCLVNFHEDQDPQPAKVQLKIGVRNGNSDENFEITRIVGGQNEDSYRCPSCFLQRSLCSTVSKQ